MTVRTRFAPSPTGYLHVGGARTALYSYLFARHYEGKFILRIEDTDLERSTEESVQAILDGMTWLNLDYDEGPYFQTQHFERYKEVIQQLLTDHKAYRCYCTKERLEQLRETQTVNKEKPRYDGHCRELNLTDENQPYVVRFKNPIDGEVVINDLVYGPIIIKNTELDDLIIARTDGSPTYNFTVVVDDWDMQITHVIRGDDHINNTPRQINILKALGAKLPEYAHIPMILGDDGKRLSKRHGAVSVLSYREMGILPEALLNYLVRLGWSNGDQEIFSIEEMIELFTLNSVNRSPAAFNQDKLLWLNQHYLKTLPIEEIMPEVIWQFVQMNITVKADDYLIAVIKAQRERVKTTKELAEKSRYFFETVESYDEEAVKKNIQANTKDLLQRFHTLLTDNDNWQAEHLHQLITQFIEQEQIKLGQLAPAVRIAITGNTVSPPIDVVLSVLGKEQSLELLCRFISWLEK